MNMNDTPRNNAPKTRGRPFAAGNPGRPKGARFEVHFEKARHFSGPDARPFEASMDPSGGWRDTDLSNEREDDRIAARDDREARILALSAAGHTQRSIASQTGAGLGTVARTIKSNRNPFGSDVPCSTVQFP